MSAADWLELFKWGVTVLVLPLIGWWAGRRALRRRLAADRRRKLALLCGLPYEMKAVLIDCYDQGAHTVARDPYEPAVAYLVRYGYMTQGPGARGYKAVNAYLTVRPDVWELMPEWVAVDIEARAILEVHHQSLPEPPQ